MITSINRDVTRVNADGEFCTLEIRYREGRFSLCAVVGVVYSRMQAKRDALEYWASFFEGSPEELAAMNAKCGTRFRSSTSAARYVLTHDGEFHGLDVHKDEGDKVYVAHSCGQCRDEMARFFPEAVPLFPWHLNDMRAGCEHQEALGWGDGKDITLTLPNAFGVPTEVTFKDSLLAPCPMCGYKYGSAWRTVEVPQEILQLAYTIA
jgi:hypothetical protein